MACRVNRNKDKIPTSVTTEGGVMSDLFNKIGSIPSIDNNTALELYKTSFSKKVLDTTGDYSKMSVNERIDKQGVFDANGEMKLFFRTQNGAITEEYSEALKIGGSQIEIGFLNTSDVMKSVSDLDMSNLKNDVVFLGNMDTILSMNSIEIMEMLGIEKKC